MFFPAKQQQHLSLKLHFCPTEPTYLRKNLEVNDFLVKSLGVPVAIKTRHIKVKKFCQANSLNYK